MTWNQVGKEGKLFYADKWANTSQKKVYSVKTRESAYCKLKPQ